MCEANPPKTADARPDRPAPPRVAERSALSPPSASPASPALRGPFAPISALFLATLSSAAGEARAAAPSGAITDMSPILADTILFCTLLMAIVFAFWVVVSEITRRGRLKMTLEYKLRVLDRLQSSEEVLAVLQSQPNAFAPTDDADLRSGLAGPITRSAQIGAVLLAAGCAFCLLAFIETPAPSALYRTLSIIACFLGAGFFLAAWLAWRLAVRLGPLPGATMSSSLEEHAQSQAATSQTPPRPK